MMALPSVLLPEPFGPMRACVSPRRIVRFTPRKMGLSSTDTCRFVIFSVSVISSSNASAPACSSAATRFDFVLTCNFLVIVQRFRVDWRRHVAAVMRDGQLVGDLHAEGGPRLPRNAVTLDLVLDSHQAFEQ